LGLLFFLCGDILYCDALPGIGLVIVPERFYRQLNIRVEYISTAQAAKKWGITPNCPRLNKKPPPVD